MKFLKSKFFLITLLVALVLAIVPTTMAAMGITAPLSNAVSSISAPFQWLGTKISGGIRGFFDYFTEFDALREENARLHEQLAAAEDAKLRGEAAVEENAFLRAFLELPEFNTEMRMTDATLIARSTDNAGRIFTLNKGTAHGVAEGMPVVTPEGLVGRVTEAGLLYACVRPITEAGVAVSIVVERSGALGICEGVFTLRDEGKCRVTDLSAEADIVVGDRILTSGYGSVYPAGLVVGVVEKVEYDSYARGKVAVIRLCADFDDLTRVMILTDFEIIAVTPPDTSTGEPEDAPVDVPPLRTPDGEGENGHDGE